MAKKQPYTLLLEDLCALREKVVSQAAERLERFRALYPDGFSEGARNLASYLSLRQFDLRPLQARLAEIGLSSLGRGESHILNNLDRIINLLQRIQRKPTSPPDPLDIAAANQMLQEHTEALFGETPNNRPTRIMVTLARDCAEDYPLVREMILKGMNCARINCAHDDEAIWRQMIQLVRRAEEETGRRCPILMDLAGRKIRTGPLTEGPAVKHIKVRRDAFGRTTGPAQVFLHPAADVGITADQPHHIALPTHVFDHLAAEDRLCFTDNRGKKRELVVSEKIADDRWLAHCYRSAWINSDTVFTWRRPEGKKLRKQGRFILPRFRGNELAVQVFLNDPLRLTGVRLAGSPARYDDDGKLTHPAQIEVLPPSVLQDLSTGQRVWIDDGKIGAEVIAVDGDNADLRVIHCAAEGAQIRADKGINLPELAISLPALTDKDLSDLDFVASHADMVGFSFVETLDDMESLITALEQRGAGHLPIVAKIESSRAVKNLPDLVLGTIGRHRLAVMIARGDLAIELGTSRLAEVQEEILWLCEAAHIPVIWATQIFETMAKKGIRSRPEITDAAMSIRAECAMLNKGPYILDAIQSLDRILERMQAHQLKKSPQLRALHW